MLLEMLRAKLHRATVTACELHYDGSLGVDEELLNLAGMLPNEMVQVYNIGSGARFETYLIREPAGSRAITLNGAAARLAQPGDLIILVTTCRVTPEEAATHQPRVVLLGPANNPKPAKP